MDNIKELYQDDLLYIFTKEQLLDQDVDYLVIIKDEAEIKEVNNCKILHYLNNFEALLKFSLPTKIRKTKQLLSLAQCHEIMSRISYGVLSFCNGDLPYSVGLNHILVDNRIFFHCAKSGYKLTGINKRGIYAIIDDLGINLKAGTHNHSSVSIFGTIREVKDFDTKKTALLKLISDLAPAHPYNDRMVETTMILELEVDYISGKTHIR